MKTSRRFVCTLAILCLGFVVSGCNDERIVFQDENPAPLLFDVTGLVIDQQSGAAVGNCEFHVLNSSETGVADDLGMFTIGAMEPGDYWIEVSAPGYATSRVDFNLTDPTLKNQQVQRPIYLWRLEGTLDVQVFGRPSGDPVAGVEVRLISSEVPGSYRTSHEIVMYSFVSLVTTDSLGVAHFPAVPVLRTNITVAPFDQDGDGIIELAAATTYAVMGEGATTHLVVFLDTPAIAAPTVLETNITTTNYVEELWLLFSRPMNTLQDALEVRLSSNVDTVPYEVESEWLSPLKLAIRSSDILDDENNYYRVFVNAESADGVPVAYQRSFHWINLPTGENGCHEVVSDLSLLPGEEAIDYDRRDLPLRWTALDCAYGYQIFARDDRNNPGWRLIAYLDSDIDTGEMFYMIELPVQFDMYSGDGVWSPFSGTAVDLCVVPRAYPVTTPEDGHPYITLRDNTPPPLPTISQRGEAMNMGSEPISLKIDVNYTEHTPETMADPVLVVTEAGGDITQVLNPAHATWAWWNGRRNGVFTCTVPPGTDYSGDLVEVLTTDLSDASGNMIAGTTVTGPLRLARSGVTFDFSDGSQGWMSDAAEWEFAIPDIGPQSGYTGMWCWCVDSEGPYGTNQTRILTSPLIDVDGDNPLVDFWCWYQLNSGDTMYVNAMGEYGDVHLLMTIQGNSPGWTRKLLSLSAYSGHTVQLVFNFQSGEMYNLDGGFFLDDVVFDCAP